LSRAGTRMYRAISLLIIISISIVQAAPCPSADKSTRPLSNRQHHTLSSLTLSKCFDDYSDFESESFASIDGLCKCQNKFKEASKLKSWVSDEEKLEAWGNGVINEVQKITLLLSQLDTILGDRKSSINMNACKVEKLFAPQCAQGQASLSQKRLEMAFKSYMDKTQNFGVASKKKFTVNNFIDKLQTETQVYLGGEGVNAKSNSCLPQDYNSKIFEMSIFDDGKLNHNAYVNSTLGKLIPLEKLVENLDSSKDFISRDQISGLNFVNKKLNGLCEKVANDIKKISCPQKPDILDIDNNVSAASASNFIDSVQKDKLNTDVSYMESVLQRGQYLCSEKKRLGTKFTDSKTGALDKALTDNFKLQAYGDDAKATEILGRILDTNYRDTFGVYTASNNVCSAICVDGEVAPYDQLGCKLKDLNKLKSELKCGSLDNINPVACKTIKVLDSVKNWEMKIAETKKLYESGELTDNDLEKISKFIPNINSYVKESKSSSLVSKFFSKKESRIKSGNSSKTNAENLAAGDEDVSSFLSVDKPQDEVIDKEQDTTLEITRIRETHNQQQNHGVVTTTTKSSGTSAVTEASKRISRLIQDIDRMTADTHSLNDYVRSLKDVKDQPENLKSDMTTIAKKSVSNVDESQNRRPSTKKSFNSNFNKNVNRDFVVADGGGVGEPLPVKEYNQIKRTDIVGDKATGISSTDESIYVKKGDAGPNHISQISKLFAGELDKNKVGNDSSKELVEIQVESTQEISLPDLLKNRDEIVPGQAFVIYEYKYGRKVAVTLVPTFAKVSGREFFSGYRPLDVTSQNRELVSRLKAVDNLLVRN
jgi:hypothetical protein